MYYPDDISPELASSIIDTSYNSVFDKELLIKIEKFLMNLNNQFSNYRNDITISFKGKRSKKKNTDTRMYLVPSLLRIMEPFQKIRLYNIEVIAVFYHPEPIKNPSGIPGDSGEIGSFTDYLSYWRKLNQIDGKPDYNSWYSQGVLNMFRYPFAIIDDQCRYLSNYMNNLFKEWEPIYREIIMRLAEETSACILDLTGDDDLLADLMGKNYVCCGPHTPHYIVYSNEKEYVTELNSIDPLTQMNSALKTLGKDQIIW